MRKKLFTNIVAIASVIAMTFALCSCGAKEKATNPVGDETSSTTQEAESSTDGEDESTSEQATTEKPTTEETTTEELTTELELPLSDIKNMTTEGFVPYSQIKEKCTFEVTFGDDNVEQSIYGSKSLKGEYQLGDGAIKNSIYVYDDGDKKAYIQIDDIKFDFYCDHIEDVAIVDVDKSDKYKEVAVLDAGPSADPNITLFRLVDNKIIELVHSGSQLDYDYILFDGKGKIISGSDYIAYLDTQIVTYYSEVSETSQVRYKVDYSEFLNKKYTFNDEWSVSFLETEDREKYPGWQCNLTLAKGEEITLIECDTEGQLYYVELSDGRRGTLCTCWGD